MALAERTIGTERAIDMGDVVLVASKSEPGTWHRVADNRCDCAGFTYRSTCRHLHVATQVMMAGIEDARPAKAPLPIPTGKAALAMASLSDD